MAKLSITQAAKEWGMSRRTLQRRVTAGTVSVTAGTGTAKAIDTSEMQRVFGEPTVTVSRGKARTTPAVSQQNVTAVSQSELQHKLDIALLKIEHLEQMVEVKNEQIKDLKTPALLTWIKRLRG